MDEVHFHLVFDGLLRSAAIFAALIIFLAYIIARLGSHDVPLQRLGCGLAFGLFSAV